jgi:outer membrane biosynthesis protein TonB
VEAAAAPKPVEKVKPKQDETPNDVEQVQKEETAAPPPPEKAIPEPKPEPKPEPQEVAKAEETPPPEDAIPVPGAKPKPEKPQPEKPKQEEAKAEEKPAKEVKPAEKPKTSDAKATDKNSKTDSKSKSSDSKESKESKETAKSKASRETDQLADEVAALLNKEDASGGGAKRSNQEASLGGKTTTGAGKLSQSEMDALKGAIQNNWNVIPGMLDAADIRIKVSFQLDRNGEVVGDPDVKVTGGDGNVRDVLASSALRAILKSAPFTNLPADKYDTWRDIIVNFDPSDFM